jgi:SAM-dependent methyltransferase
MQAYFNYAYTPIYDLTVARLNRYRKLQERCVDKLELEDNDKVLCVGLGTGNEIFHILEMNRNVSIVGVDYSHTALQKAYKKALAWGKEIEVLTMDARCLEFPDGSFDKALCIHLMDFVGEDEKVTGEIIRVLKKGGNFVITYPSYRESIRLGLNLLSDSVCHGINSGKHRIRALLESSAQMLVGIVYLPFLFWPKRKPYSRSELESMITRLTTGDFQIEEDPIYQDFIVYGRK